MTTAVNIFFIEFNYTKVLLWKYYTKQTFSPEIACEKV